MQSQQAQSSAAQIEVARADANLAQANLDRALQLVDRGFISKADVDAVGGVGGVPEDPLGLLVEGVHRAPREGDRVT